MEYRIWNMECGIQIFRYFVCSVSGFFVLGLPIIIIVAPAHVVVIGEEHFSGVRFVSLNNNNNSRY